MRTRDKKSSLVYYISVFLVIGTILATRFSFSFSAEQLRLYISLMVSYIWIGGLLLFAKKNYDLYIFEPLSFVSAIYLAVFIVKPLIDLKTGHMIEHDVNVLGGGLKATAVLLLGYTLMYIGYYLTYDCSGRMNLENLPDVDEKTEYEASGLYIIWAFSFVMCLICVFSQGLSLRYIFTLGKAGEITVSEGNTALLFLSNFVVTMLSAWMLILFRTENSLGKLAISVLEVIYLMMRNSRWLILVFILAPITYYYTGRRKRPRGTILLIAATVALFIFAWMQANRVTLASGGALQGWGEGGFTLGKLIAPFESDLNTYRAFFSMVDRFPERYPFLLGISYVYVFLLFIPRVLWKGKPDNPIKTIIEHSLNRGARISGTAVANIGEIYANFGTLGCVVIMFILGRLLAWMKTFFQGRSDDNLIAYSIMYPLLFQWIARGNFGGNFYMTIFALLPFFVRKYLSKQGKQGDRCAD